MPKDPNELVRKEVTINGMKTTLRLTQEQADAMPDVEPYATDPNAEATDLVTSGTTGRGRRGARSTARGSARSTTRGTVEGSASDDDGAGDDSGKE